MGDADFEYEVPPGASELGKQRLAQLVGLAMQRKVNRHKPGPGQKENLTLELMAKDVGLGTSRFYTPKSKTLVNTKCLIAKILAILVTQFPQAGKYCSLGSRRPSWLITPFRTLSLAYQLQMQPIESCLVRIRRMYLVHRHICSKEAGTQSS